LGVVAFLKGCNWREPAGGRAGVCLRPRVELRPPVYPSPVFRADLVLVGAVHLGGGGSQRRHGYRVGDCSAEGGTRLGCVRAALGTPLCQHANRILTACGTHSIMSAVLRRRTEARVRGVEGDEGGEGRAGRRRRALAISSLSLSLLCFITRVAPHCCATVSTR
jgi:hypothetical protein